MDCLAIIKPDQQTIELIDHTQSTRPGQAARANSQGISQSPVVREVAGIRDDQVIQTCVAMDWPDDSFPANAVVSHRKSLDEAAVFIGLDD